MRPTQSLSPIILQRYCSLPFYIFTPLQQHYLAITAPRAFFTSSPSDLKRPRQPSTRFTTFSNRECANPQEPPFRSKTTQVTNPNHRSKSIQEALELCQTVQMEGVEPHSLSILNLAPDVLKLENVASCKSMHGSVVARCNCDVVPNSLTVLYSKYSEVNLDRCIFYWMRVKYDVSWITMMVGYV